MQDQTSLKAESERRRLLLFMSALAVLALIINSFFFTRRTSQTVDFSSVPIQAERVSRTQQLATEKSVGTQPPGHNAAEEEAAQHARDLARYLNTSVIRKPGTKTVAIVVASEDGKLNHDLSAALAEWFQADKVETLSALFAPEFVYDGLFADTFDGSLTALTRLDLTNSLDVLVLGRQTVKYSQTAALDNLFTANMQLEAIRLPVARRGDSKAWTFAANGAGFKREEARVNAEKRLIKQITGETNPTPRVQWKTLTQ